MSLYKEVLLAVYTKVLGNGEKRVVISDGTKEYNIFNAGHNHVVFNATSIEVRLKGQRTITYFKKGE